MSEEQKDAAENPGHFTGLKLEKPQQVAAGMKAVFTSANYILKEPGIFRGLKALSALNQKEGFDCPSCAWPDPDRERSFAEYCENGAKAVAEEATSKIIAADFFLHHSLASLAALSDYEIGKKGRIAEPVHLAEGTSNY